MGFLFRAQLLSMSLYHVTEIRIRLGNSQIRGSMDKHVSCNFAQSRSEKGLSRHPIHTSRPTCTFASCLLVRHPTSQAPFHFNGGRGKKEGGEDQREFPSSSFSPPTSSMQTPQNEKRPGEEEAEREDEGGENSHSGGGRARCPPLLPLHSPVFCRDPLNGRKVPILFLLLPPLPTHRLSHMSCLYSGKTFARHRLQALPGRSGRRNVDMGDFFCLHPKDVSKGEEAGGRNQTLHHYVILCVKMFSAQF